MCVCVCVWGCSCCHWIICRCFYLISTVRWLHLVYKGSLQSPVCCCVTWRSVTNVVQSLEFILNSVGLFVCTHALRVPDVSRRLGESWKYKILLCDESIFAQWWKGKWTWWCCFFFFKTQVYKLGHLHWYQKYDSFIHHVCHVILMKSSRATEGLRGFVRRHFGFVRRLEGFLISPVNDLARMCPPPLPPPPPPPLPPPPPSSSVVSCSLT